MINIPSSAEVWGDGRRWLKDPVAASIGSAAMSPYEEYQRYAEECMHWAEWTKSEGERKAFIDMARAWTRAALLIQAVMVPMEESEPSKPTAH
jgi:hypothetical protein